MSFLKEEYFYLIYLCVANNLHSAKDTRGVYQTLDELKLSFNFQLGLVRGYQESLGLRHLSLHLNSRESDRYVYSVVYAFFHNHWICPYS